MRRTRWSFTVVAGLLACGCDDPKKQGALPSATAAPTTGLFIGDNRTPTPTALVVGTDGEHALRFVLSTDPLSCSAVTSAYPERPSGAPGTMLDFWLAQPLAADGTEEAWSFRSAYLTDEQGGRGLRATGALLTGVTAAKGRVAVAGLELALGDGRAGRELTWTGDLEAVDCGRIKRKEPEEQQDKLGLSISGKRYPIGGATLRPEGKKRILHLTRAPHGCNSILTEGYDFFVSMVIEGEPPRVTLVSLEGDVFPDFPSRSVEPGQIVLGLDGDADAGPGDIEIEGKIDVRGYALELKGSLDARRCVLLR